jgi:YVTN family beta-propeller protein
VDYSSLTDHSFQIVNATVTTTTGGLPAIAVAYRSDVPLAVAAMVVGVPYSVNESGGTTTALACCSTVTSVSNVTSASASATITTIADGEETSTLVFGSLAGGVYWVDVFVTSPDRSTVLSPVSRVLLNTTDSAGICGGQDGSAATFFDSANDEVYVANDGTETITTINGSSDQIITTISLPVSDSQLAFYLYDPGNKDLYVGAEATNSTFVIDTTTNFLVANITLTQIVPFPNDTSFESMVYDQGNGRIFAVNPVDNFVSVIDGSTNTVVAKVAGIQAPVSGTYDPKNGDIYVQAGNGTMFLMDGSTYRITGSLQVPGSFGNLVYDPDNGLFYTAAAQTASISTEFLVAVNASSNFLQQRILANSTGRLLFYDSFNGDLYLCCTPSAALTALDVETDSVVATVSLPGVNFGEETAEYLPPQPSFFYDGVNGDVLATDVEVTSHDIGVTHISASSNTIVSKTFLPPLQPGNLALDETDGRIFGGDGPSVYVLDLSSGATTTVSLGSCG